MDNKNYINKLESLAENITAEKKLYRNFIRIFSEELGEALEQVKNKHK